MGRLRVLFGFAVLVLASPAVADEKCPTPPRGPTVTWGATPSAAASTPAVDESPVSCARGEDGEGAAGGAQRARRRGVVRPAVPLHGGRPENLSPRVPEVEQ